VPFEGGRSPTAWNNKVLSEVTHYGIDCVLYRMAGFIVLCSGRSKALSGPFYKPALRVSVRLRSGYVLCRVTDFTLTGVPPYPRVIRSKTYLGCVKPGVIPNAINK
jgi:hypothetical protein